MTPGGREVIRFVSEAAGAFAFHRSVCMMWPLLFICISTVGAIPVNPNVTSRHDTHGENITTVSLPAAALRGADVPLNDTLSATTPPTVGDIPVNLNESMRHNTSRAADVPLNDTLSATTPPTVGAIPVNPNVTTRHDTHGENIITVSLPAAALRGADVPLNDTLSATTPPTVGDIPVNLNESMRHNTSRGADVPLNDTLSATTPPPVGAIPVNPNVTTRHDTHGENITTVSLPAAALRGADVPLNDTLSATTPPPVGDIPVNLNESTRHNTNRDADVPLNETLSATTPSPGAVNVQLDVPPRASAETLEELKDDMIVEEGDILVPVHGYEQEDRNAVQTVWAEATVAYVITDELAYQLPNILAAFKMISDFTCIRFQQRTTEYNYLKFQSGNGCASFVGCQGGAQRIYYSPSCSVGNLCHEVIHALGLHHEHTRKDRDQYINVQWQNIMPGRKKNFRIKNGNTLNLPYDLNSIMHYGPYFFSIDGSATVVSNQGGVQMGQRAHLSPLDIEKLNRLYHCADRMRWK